MEVRQSILVFARRKVSNVFQGMKRVRRKRKKKKSKFFVNGVECMSVNEETLL